MFNAINIHSISKNFGTVKTVDRINVTVRRGEIYDFLGLNGVGCWGCYVSDAHVEACKVLCS